MIGWGTSEMSLSFQIIAELIHINELPTWIVEKSFGAWLPECVCWRDVSHLIFVHLLFPCHDFVSYTICEHWGSYSSRILRLLLESAHRSISYRTSGVADGHRLGCFQKLHGTWPSVDGSKSIPIATPAESHDFDDRRRSQQ
jgi:hypothetical protein